MKRVHVKASESYDVIIDCGAATRIGEYAAEIGCKRCILVCDSTVADLHMAAAIEALTAAGIAAESYVFPAGEQSKCVDTYIDLIRRMASARLSRADAVIALGGGVTGDLAGFAAATYMRGIRLIQMPTTLLACVDSSVGGKTAVDLPEGKNLLGAFYQPNLVICDPLLLRTLPENVFSDGCAEVIKYGMIRSADILENLNNAQLSENPETIIEECVKIKRDIVQTDEFDNGQRQLLNFGHTFGHAIEAQCDFALSHGKCVAIGMAMITRAAVRRGICDRRALDALLRLLDQYSLPRHAPCSADQIAARACMDKKVRGGVVSLVVPIGIGECRIVPVQSAELIDWAREGIE